MPNFFKIQLINLYLQGELILILIYHTNEKHERKLLTKKMLFKTL